MSGDYRLVFDIADHPFPLGPALFVPLIFTAIGALLVFRPALMRRLLPWGLQGRSRQVFSWVYFVFAILVTGSFLTTTLGQSHRLKTALARGEAEVSEGCLQAFHPKPVSGHGTERLRLNGRCFAYSDQVVTPGDNRTEARGGPVPADRGLRVTHLDGTILRLEVRDHACPAVPDPSPGQAC